MKTIKIEIRNIYIFINKDIFIYFYTDINKYL